jgi:hypothetical protein
MDNGSRLSGLTRRILDRNSTLLIALLLTVPAFLVAGRQDVRHWKVTVLWSGVFIMAGGMVGFLFGILPNREAEQAGSDNENSTLSPRSNANTNLESVADWLTKILIGLALINAKDLPEQLGRLTSYVAKGLDGAPDEPFVMALIIYFGIAGFILGYLAARVYFRLLASESGSRALASLAENVESAIARQIERALSGPVLTNYDGYLCLSVNEAGALCNVNEGTVLLRNRAGALTVQAWLQPEAPSDSRVATAAVSIRDGEDRGEAEFEIRVDADDFRLIPTRGTVTAHASGGSKRIKFEGTYEIALSTPNASASPGGTYETPRTNDSDEEEFGPKPPQHPFWLMLFQHNRLLQTITLDFKAPN